MAPVSDRVYEVSNAALLRVLRLFIDGVEVTQAIQHYGSASHLTDPADRGADNSLRLVADKPAWVRVYVVGRGVTATGTVEVFKRSNGFLWQSIGVLAAQPPGSVQATLNPDYATVRRTLSSTLNFIIPREMMCGNLRLVVNVAAGAFTDSMTLSLNVTLQQTLRLAGVMISYNGPQSNAPNAPTITIAAPTIADLQAMTGAALTRFPVRSTANFRSAGTIAWDRHLQDPFGATGCTTNWDALHAAVVNARTADGNQAGWVYYGLLPTGVPMGPVGGCGGGGVSVGPVGADLTMAHEIAHACGLEHAPCGGAPRPDPNFPTYEPYPMASIGEYGLDVNNGNIFDPATARDLMSYCSPKWISPYHHRLLVDNARLNPTIVCMDHPWWKDLVWMEKPKFPRIPLPDPPPFDLDLSVLPPALPPADVISLIVRVSRGAVADVLHITRSQVRPEIEGSVETPLTARLLDARGQVLSEATLRRVPTEACGCGRSHAGSCQADPDSYLAQAFVPNVARGSSLDISDGKTTQWKRKAPKTPIRVTTFEATVERDQSVRASWSTRGKPVEFWLRYSIEKDVWRSIATGITERGARVPAGVLPSGKVQLQVVAHDGFHSHESTSVELTIPEHGPTVAILHPADGFTYVEGQSLRLWGSATDPTGASAPGEHCSWTLDGHDLGRGLDMWIAAPAEGRHELTLTAGREARSSATITFVTTKAIDTMPTPPHDTSAARKRASSTRKAAPRRRRARRE